jgi:hypothetical protein
MIGHVGANIRSSTAIGLSGDALDYVSRKPMFSRRQRRGIYLININLNPLKGGMQMKDEMIISVKLTDDEMKTVAGGDGAATDTRDAATAEMSWLTDQIS